MMRFSKAAGVLAGLSALIVATGADAQSLTRRYALMKLQEDATTAAAVVAQTEGKACEAQLPTLKAAYADRRFPRMDVEARQGILYTLILCAEGEDLALAAEAGRKLAADAKDPHEVMIVYSVQISEALQRGATAEAARLFLKLSELQPDAVAEWSPEMVSNFADYIEGEPDLSLKVVERIATLKWTDPASQRAALNEWALAYGWQLADRGRFEDAGKAVSKATDLYVTLIVAGDRRFSSVWDSWQRERRFDWTALAQANLDKARTDMAEQPGSLRPVNDYLGALRTLGRYDEAIQVGQAFAARIEDGETFEDARLKAPSVQIQLAQALFETGRYGEAEAVFVKAIGEDSSVDARIAWGGRLLDLGRPRDVLKVLEGVDANDITPYGQLWVDSQRACAQADIDKGAAEKTLALLEAGKGENPAALSQALLCMNRVDEAAKLMVSRLGEPRHRAGALDPYWITRRPPALPAWLTEFERRRQAMLNHPDVLKALDAAGRKVEAPLAGDYWGGF